MTEYSGVELVKQEQCKLTYATFLTNIIECYNKKANKLVLHNPYSFETQYNKETKTVYNSAFELSAVDIDIEASITDFKLVLNLSNTATGLKLVLKAGKYRRISIIPESHLAICDTYSQDCLDYPETYNPITDNNLDLITDPKWKFKRDIDLDDFLSLIDCYDITTNKIAINNPYYENTSYKDNAVFSPLFSIPNALLSTCTDAQKLIFTIPSPFTFLLKTPKGWANYTLDPSTFKQCPSTPCKGLTIPSCFDTIKPFKVNPTEITIGNTCMQDNICTDFGCFPKDTKCYDPEEVNDGQYIKACQKVLYNGKEIGPCFTLSDIFKVPSDKLTINSSCAQGEICTDFGCVPEYILGDPCKDCSSLSYTQAPTMEAGYNDFMYTQMPITKYSLYSKGNLVGKFKDSYTDGVDISVVLFNIYDYFTPKAYRVNADFTDIEKTINVLYYIATKFLNFSPVEASNLSKIDLDAGQVMQIFPGVSSMTFDWTKILSQNMTGNISEKLAPCRYKDMIIHNNSDGSSLITVEYRFINNFIPSIDHTSLDMNDFITAYNIYADKVKWLITSEAYAYAVYQGYLDPNIPITY